MENKKIFSANLQNFVEKSGKSRKDIAQDLNVSQSTFNDWYNGTSYPNIEKIEKIADYFGIKKYQLIEKHDTAFATAVGKLLATDDEYFKKLVIGISKLSLQEKVIVSKTIELFVNIIQE